MIANNMRIQDASLSDPGKVRSVNEDSFLARPLDGLWVVADGMGGHVNGQWASRAVVAALGAAPLPDSFDEATAAVAEAMHSANEVICAEGWSAGASMGSTAVALLVRGDRFATLWVGDSRCYVYRRGVVHQLTTDHSQVQEMVQRGHLTPEEAETHPMSHVLSRAVGVQEDLELDAITDQIEVGDIFLLCSDGLTRTVDASEMATILGSHNAHAAADLLVKLCLERGAPDNVTVVVVACEAATILAPA